MGARIIWLALILTLLLAAPASAADPSAPATEAPAEAEADTRWFVASTIDVGVFYFRPRASFGWGLPFESWLGMDVNPLVSSEGYGAWAGLRFALPAVDLRVGARHFRTFRRSFLPQQEEYDRIDIELRDGPDSRYTSLEAELTWSLPFGRLGRLFGEAALTYVTGVPDGYNVYEERIRLVLQTPWVWRGRLGFAVRTALGGALTLGPVFEVVGNPGRPSTVLRFGAVARLKLYDDLEVRGTFIPVMLSPDNLGLKGGDSFQIGLRWRWATGGL